MFKFIIGGKGPGFKDGRFSDAEFSSPQGLAIHGYILYVADTNNHAIRKVRVICQT
ncbi:hypothetical protein DPMN_165808 [Dreissena polymorpha]|uniref:Uncharacterized protein n=1 Tax=Dreissena polymorpha TaxID=45954 RepID=A0A9D4EXJ6_DREPO|nr:hypothetical protein DPMN_165808 [Dreissena polymorpha]